MREFVKGHAGCSAAEIAAGCKLDGKFVRTVAAQRVRAGEFVRDGDGYTWNNDYVPGKHGQRSAGGPKIKGNKALLREQRKQVRQGKPGNVRSMRDLVKKHAPVTLDVLAPTQTQKLQWHVRSTFANLQSIINLEGADTALIVAFRVHEESVLLLDAGACPF